MARDKLGRWEKGTSGNQGQKGRRQGTVSFRTLLREQGEKNWEKVLKKAWDMAIDGDAPARRFLVEYDQGRPVERVELDVNRGPEITKEEWLAQYRGTTPEERREKEQDVD